MLCLSTPAAPPLLATLRQAAASVVRRSALSIKLNHLFPLTPLPSADNIRSVQTEVSTHDQSRPCVSAPCLALSDTVGACACFSSSFTSPPSCLPSLSMALLFHAFRKISFLSETSSCRYYAGSDSCHRRRDGRSLRLSRTNFLTFSLQPRG